MQKLLHGVFSSSRSSVSANEVCEAANFWNDGVNKTLKDTMVYL